MVDTVIWSPASLSPDEWCTGSSGGLKLLLLNNNFTLCIEYPRPPLGRLFVHPSLARPSKNVVTWWMFSPSAPFPFTLAGWSSSSLYPLLPFALTVTTADADALTALTHSALIDVQVSERKGGSKSRINKLLQCLHLLLSYSSCCFLCLFFIWAFESMFAKRMQLCGSVYRQYEKS